MYDSTVCRGLDPRKFCPAVGTRTVVLSWPGQNDRLQMRRVAKAFREGGGRMYPFGHRI